MSNVYAPLQRWHCDHCGKAGELSIPPESYGADLLELATRAHRIANHDCHDDFGNTGVRVSQGAYPD